MDVGFGLLAERYNPRCEPPWDDDDLHQLCEDADATSFEKPRGWLLDAGNSDNIPPTPPAGTGPNTTAANAKPAGWSFTPVDSAAFAAGDYRLTYLVRGCLVAGQPMVVAGPQKTLKTSLLIDLAVSLASGTPFLGKFATDGKHRVAFLSGESGEATIQETARRVCAARGVGLADLDVLWQFALPQFGRPADVNALSEGLRAAGVGVVVVDPLYLCLGVDLNAANLYEVGARLSQVARGCLDAGATPIVAHHANRQLRTGVTMELHHLAFAGIAEFARQWILINRQVVYEGDGGTRSRRRSAGRPGTAVCGPSASTRGGPTTRAAGGGTSP